MRPAIQQAPALDGDAALAKLGVVPHARMRVERSLVWNLGVHLGAHGFEPIRVLDGGDIYITRTMKDAMEHIFAVDESTLYFRKPSRDAPVRHVFLVLGNDGYDSIADHSTLPASDGFPELMDRFDTDRFMPDTPLWEVCEAETMGAQAKAAGRMCVPAQCSELPRLLRGRPVGTTPPPGRASTIAVLDAWLRGWNSTPHVEHGRAA